MSRTTTIGLLMDNWMYQKEHLSDCGVFRSERPWQPRRQCQVQDVSCPVKCGHNDITRSTSGAVIYHTYFALPTADLPASMASHTCLIVASNRHCSNRKRRHFSSGNQSSCFEAGLSTTKCYAGPKFTSPPSPEFLPLPPLHWRLDSGVASKLLSGSYSMDNLCRCAEMTNAIKHLLRI